MRYSVVHKGVPVGTVQLEPGELVAGVLAPLPALGPLLGTIYAGSEALFDLGFLGFARPDRRGSIDALRAAASLEFDLVDDRGHLESATFVNLIESPEDGIVVLARFSLAHGADPARLRPVLSHGPEINGPMPMINLA